MDGYYSLPSEGYYGLPSVIYIIKICNIYTVCARRASHILMDTHYNSWW